MKVNNALRKKIAIRWDSITLPLKEGTPISLGGVIANDGNAFGLVEQTITKRPNVDSIFILIAGDVCKADVEKAYGTTISNDAIKSMSGFRFIDVNGEVIDIYQKDAFVLPIMDKIADADASSIVTQFNALLSALKDKGYMKKN